ncbi:unnamed protein product [Leptosia nina]|uniref:UDP-glucuronosyltransferase n=1 Tax=Leptosia nina TaxID=320188 RepID=A0AAV1JI26_9NEOP
MLGVWSVLSVVFLNFYTTECAKILGVFPTPSISHQVVFRPLIHELAKRGHEVIVITPDPAFPKGQAPANLTEIDVHDISYKNWEDLLNSHNGKKEDIREQVINLIEKFTSTFEKQINTPEVKRILTEERYSFDLIISEASVRMILGLAHWLKTPIVQISSFGTTPVHYGLLGATTHPLLYPSPITERLYNMTLWEKGWELFKHFAFEHLLLITEESDHKVARRNFGEDLPSFDNLFREYVQMLFLNEHQIWAHNHPVPPNIVYVGGIHQTPTTELPKDLKTFLDTSRNGVIYTSFGTNVKPANLPREKVQMMLTVFSKLPYDVLLKWDEDMSEKPSNVKTAKWLPQAQLLKHPNVKLFITQGGLQSTDELINAAVPVIGIPMLGDQWYNTEKYVHHKIGQQLDIHQLTEEKFANAIKTVIEDKSYKENVIRLQSLMRKFPIKPLDLAVWWTEHILEYGGSHLRPPSFMMSSYDYYEVPLIAALLATSCVLLYIVVLIMFAFKRLLSYILKNIRIKVKKL